MPEVGGDRDEWHGTDIDRAHQECSVAGGGNLPGLLTLRVCAAAKGWSTSTDGGGARPHEGRRGPGGRFFHTTPTYLFIGDYKYWVMTHHDVIDLDQDHTEHVLNRAGLYRDRRDFVIQQGDTGQGDTGQREDYPAEPAREQ